MSFLYPRTVRVARPQGVAALGVQGYSGLSQLKESVVYSSVAAHIQPERQGKSPLPGLPADAEGQPIWRIVAKLPKNTVHIRDVLTDDLGQRYQVIYANWNPLSTTILAVSLNVVGTPATQVIGWEAEKARWGQTGRRWGESLLPGPWDQSEAQWGQAGQIWGGPAGRWGHRTGGWGDSGTTWGDHAQPGGIWGGYGGTWGGGGVWGA